MFASDLILKAGGGAEPNHSNYAACVPSVLTNRAFKIQLSDASPIWEEVASMPRPRLHFYLIALPDGRVLAIGGTTGGPTGDDFCGCQYAAREPDLYDPATDTWTTMNPMRWPRMYHSAAVLLPDGSVFVAGGEARNLATTDQWTYEIFQPPYFAQGTRPTITSAPANMYYNQAHTVTTPDAGDITKVRIIRLGAATHSFDHDQRMLEVPFSVLSSNSIRVSMPTHGNLAPPGYYMLFICKDSPAGGVGTLPSESKIFRLRVFHTPELE